MNGELRFVLRYMFLNTFERSSSYAQLTQCPNYHEVQAVESRASTFTVRLDLPIRRAPRTQPSNTRASTNHKLLSFLHTVPQTPSSPKYSLDSFTRFAAT